jgi:hypothetical protein
VTCGAPVVPFEFGDLCTLMLPMGGLYTFWPGVDLGGSSGRWPVTFGAPVVSFACGDL